jgi:PAS domain S-box-containing protein
MVRLPTRLSFLLHWIVLPFLRFDNPPSSFRIAMVADRSLFATITRVSVGAAILLGLYLSSFYSYLLFHSLIEIFTVAVACGVFMIAWNSRRLLENNYLLFIGIAYIFVAALDLLHALSYKNMGVFPGLDADAPTQLWIAARYLQSVSLLAAPLFLARRLKPGAVVAAFAATVSLILASIFAWRTFPPCFIEGAGLTPFKKGSEYVISVILLASLALLLRKRGFFDRRVLYLLSASILLLVCAEVAFTFYVSVFGLSNLVGHFAKGVAFYLIYMALVETGLTRPYDLLFRGLKESEERYRRLYNETPVMLHSVDRAGRLVNVSNYWLEYLGYGRDEVLGRKSTELLTADSRRYAEEVALPEFFATGSLHDIPYRVMKKNGEVIDVLMTAAAERDGSGEIVSSLAVTVDVTDRKKAAEEIATLNLRLHARAAELEETNCELETALEDLEAVNLELATSNHDLEALNRTVSHDLRSPLTGINGFCELMLDFAPGRLDPQSIEYLRHIHSSAKRMDQLIVSLLEFARLSHCELRREKVDLSREANGIAAELRIAGQERAVEFSIAEGVTAEGDPRLLRLVLQNLLGNAWKYTGREESAIIEFGTSDVDGRTACFVRDNGPGFPMAEAEKLFNPFHRLPGAAGFAGHGIGLATVHRIIQRHGGRVWGEGEPGKGATFYFSL